VRVCVRACVCVSVCVCVCTYGCIGGAVNAASARVRIGLAKIKAERGGGMPGERMAEVDRDALGA
jgi:hypothetical protein